LFQQPEYKSKTIKFADASENPPSHAKNKLHP
jgi:hypothetical protein